MNERACFELLGDCLLSHCSYLDFNINHYIYSLLNVKTVLVVMENVLSTFFTQHICAVMGDAERLLASQAEIDNVLDNVEVRRPPTPSHFIQSTLRGTAY